MRGRIALQKHFVRNVYQLDTFREALGLRTRPRVAFLVQRLCIDK
jgi:hypothetical protein